MQLILFHLFLKKYFKLFNLKEILKLKLFVKNIKNKKSK